ncbi:MAG: VCBS repeat-containing protein, partial [Planctomycetes bacterium]|nr:VCBS repeat-containing protein [Planctomycetota bacterium]
MANILCLSWPESRADVSIAGSGGRKSACLAVLAPVPWRAETPGPRASLRLSLGAGPNAGYVPPNPMPLPQTSALRGLAVVALAVIPCLPAAAQQYVQQTSTRFPVQFDYTNQCTVVDIDGDTDLDIVWANGQGYSTQGTALPVRVYVNNGLGVFADETATRAAGITGWYRGVEAGDVDRDGDWDLILANDFNKRPQLLINNGAGVFSDQTTTRLPTFTMSSARAHFGDVDNDGDLDLAFCNNGATRFGSGQPRLYLNDGTGIFADATANLPVGNI